MNCKDNQLNTSNYSIQILNQNEIDKMINISDNGIKKDKNIQAVHDKATPYANISTSALLSAEKNTTTYSLDELDDILEELLSKVDNIE